MANVVVVGDDLTGSNATGVLYAHAGLNAVTVSSLPAARRVLNDVDVLVITTESRHLPAEEARGRVREAVRELSCEGRLIVKRIDTTLRGNVGAECDAVLQAAASGMNAAPGTLLMVPAFPSSGRTTVGGIQFLDGVPVEQTWAGKDPFTPVRHSRVGSVLAEQSSMSVAEIDIDQVHSSPEYLRMLLADASRSADCVIVDSIDDSDLRIVAAAAAAVQNSGEAYWAIADTGPFGAHLASALGLTGVSRRTPSPILALFGSLTEQTVAQIARLEAERRVCLKTISPADDAGEVTRCLREWAEQGFDVIGVRTSEANKDSITPEDSLAMQRLLSRITQAVASGVRLAGIYATGGDVATNTITALGADGFQIADEVLPLAVIGSLVGGSFDGLSLATKGGLIGSEDAAVRCIDALHRRALLRAPTEPLAALQSEHSRP